MALQKRLGNNLSDAGIARVSMSQDGVLYNVGGQNITTVSLVEEVLASIALPRNLIFNSREGVYIWLFGTTAANGDPKRIRVRLGSNSLTGSTLLDTGSVNANNGAFVCEGWLLRAGAASSELIGRTGLGVTPAFTYAVDTTTTMATLSGLTITGQTTTAAGDLTLKGYRVVYLSRGGVMTLGGVLA